MVVSFEEAREFWEGSHSLANAYLAKVLAGGGIDEDMLKAMYAQRDAYRARLGDQQDPYTSFERYQSALLRHALRTFMKPEGRRAYEEYRRNEILPSPPPDRWEDDPRFHEPDQEPAT